MAEYDMTTAEFLAKYGQEPRKNKYWNIPTIGLFRGEEVTFASGHECEVVGNLELQERAGDLEILGLQVEVKIRIEGQKFRSWVADAVIRARRELTFKILPPRCRVWRDRIIKPDEVVYIDAKRPETKTPTYRMKRELVRLTLGIEILEL